MRLKILAEGGVGDGDGVGVGGSRFADKSGFCPELMIVLC